MPTLLSRAVQACVEAGMSKTAVADALGIKRPHLYEMCDGYRHINPVLFWLLPAPGRNLIAEALAGEGCVVVAVPPADAMEDGLETIDAMQIASSKAVHECIRAFRDGMVDGQEGVKLKAAGAAMMRHGAQLDAIGGRAIKHGVQGVPTRPRAVRGGAA